jgi:hypothetical protein
MKLYQLKNDYLKALDSVDSSNLLENVHINDQLLPEDRKLVVSNALAEIKDSFEDKAIAVAKYIKNLEAEATAIEDAVKLMMIRNKKLLNQSISLKEYLHFNIKQTGLLDKIKCPEFEIWLKKNPVSVQIVDEGLIPSLYLKEKKTVTIDKIAIKKSIEEGFEVVGAKLINTETLVIK